MSTVELSNSTHIARMYDSFYSVVYSSGYMAWNGTLIRERQLVKY